MGSGAILPHSPKESLHCSLSCLGPPRLSFCCCCPPLAPRTQPAHGTQPHHSWGMKALLTHSPSVLARGGPQEQKQKVKTPRRTDKQTKKGPGGSAKEGAQDPAGKGKIFPPLIMTDTSTSTPKHNAFTLSPVNGRGDFIRRRTREGVCRGYPSRKPEAQGGQRG